MIKVILFDFDGTIADSFDSFIEIVKKLSEKYNLPSFTPEELESFRLEEPRNIIKKLKIPLFKLPLIARDMKRMQLENIKNIKPIKNMPETLIKLKNSDFKLGIITSNGNENVQSFLINNNIVLFNYLICDVGIFGKEKAIKNFYKKFNFQKEDVIYIGDEIRDINASRKAGVKIISVTWGLNSSEGLKNYNPDYLIYSPEEIFDLLKN